jgi:4-amino-4-deoxy-L-arabinose transferase-like glycosyltransferase
MLVDKLSEPSSRGLSNFWSIVSLLTVGGLAFFLRFYGLTHHSLWYDEGLSLMRSDGDTLGQVLETLNNTPYDKYQPTYFIGLFYWRRLFGDTEFALRAFSVLLGLGSIALTASISRRLFGPRHALWTAAIMAASAYHVYYSQEVRAYSLVMMLAALQLWLFSPALLPRFKVCSIWTLGFWGVTTLSLLSSVFLFLFTLALCAAHGMTLCRVRPWARYWAPLLICAGPSLLFYSTSEHFYGSIPQMLQRLGSGGLVENLAFVVSGLLAGVTYLAPTDQLRGPDRLKVMLEYWPQLCLLLGVLTTLGIATLRQVVAERRHPTSQLKPTVFLGGLLAASLLLSIFFSAATGMPWLPRHGAFIYLVIALIVPATFCRSTETLPIGRGIRRAALGATVTLLLINGVALRNYYGDYRYARDDYRAVAAYVNQHRDADTVSILLWGNARLFRYYGDTHTVSNWNLDGQGLLSEVEAIAGEAERVLILVNREQSRLQYSVPEILQTSYHLDEITTFRYFTAYWFEAS